MTYPEFYQAWAALVMQNVSVITIPEISCSRATLFITIGIETILFFLIYHNRIISNFARAFILLSIYSIVLLFTSVFLRPSSECKKSEFNPIPAKIIYEYPDNDYSVQEFQENMVTLGENASIEQKELAKLVMQNCITQSKNIRECIFNSKPTFEKAELNRIKF